MRAQRYTPFRSAWLMVDDVDGIRCMRIFLAACRSAWLILRMRACLNLSLNLQLYFIFNFNKML